MSPLEFTALLFSGLRDRQYLWQPGDSPENYHPVLFDLAMECGVWVVTPAVNGSRNPWGFIPLGVYTETKDGVRCRPKV
ncbi:hypothetical protein BaRGS_00013273 [Batillaria attramentaria]|uniref:Uncharacterized protein n=1 Tax=Batillaria attramentaria TaxID=370345 RepID=A0ABD0L8A2_9CAEN